MKRLISLVLVLALVFLCGCAGKDDATSEVSEVSLPSITDFATTTLMADDVLTFRILSAHSLPATDGSDGVGVAYAIGLKNMTIYPIQVDITDITVNDQPLNTKLSVKVEKSATKSETLSLESGPLENLGIEKVEKVGLHVKVTNLERWSAPAMTERDLVFYTPLAPTVPAATGTATATATA